jgi:hypothetical protein
VYDISKRGSYDNVARWLKELRDHADQNIVSAKFNLWTKRGISCVVVDKRLSDLLHCYVICAGDHAGGQ